MGGDKMTLSKGLNASKATFTKNRTPDSVSPFSGLCTTCLEGCPGLCEVGKSAFRGREVLYPQPYGKTTFASEKDYPVDFSHFNIMGTAVGAHGIEADSDKAIFPAVNIESQVGNRDPIKLKVPFVIPGLGSTKIAEDNWEDLAAGAAISGAILTIGENVCGMDPNSVFKSGRVVNSPNLKKRVKDYWDWQNGYGEVVVQSNVEDTKLGVLEYAIQELGVKAVELKWGQGAKNIGGEVKVSTLKEALTLKKRGYVACDMPWQNFCPVILEISMITWKVCMFMVQPWTIMQEVAQISICSLRLNQKMVARSGLLTSSITTF
jgi:hypothetical protein